MIFQVCASRLAADGHAFGEVLRRYTAHLTDAEFQDLWPRLSLLYDVLCPPPEPK